MAKFHAFFAVIVAAISTTTFAAPTTTNEPITNVSDPIDHSHDGDFHGKPYKPGLAFVPDLIVTPEGENLTIPNGDNDDGPPGQQPINPDRWIVTSTGTVPRNAGLPSRSLADEVQRILREQCDGGWDYIPGPMCRRDVRRIGRIPDRLNDQNGFLDMKIESDYIPLPVPGKPGAWNTDKRAFLDLFIRRISQTVAASIQCDKNHWQYHFLQGKEWCYKYVNIADWYQIAVKNRADFPHMKVSFRSNQRSAEGQYDCKGTQTNVWGSFTQSDYLGLAKAVGENVRWAVECADNWGGQVDGWPVGYCSRIPKDLVSCTLEGECDHH